MQIQLYESSSGRKLILEYIASQDDEKAKKRMVRLLERLESSSFGQLRKANILEKMITSKPDIYEAKVKHNGMEHRFLGGLVGQCYYVTHAFPKKEQKTRDKEIALAQQRLKEFMPS